MTAMRATRQQSRGANAYARISVESSVMSASPHQIISTLFDGAINAIRTARVHLQEGNIAEKGQYITKAINIVNSGLLAALDAEKGGEIATRLASLYDYTARLLMSANLRNDEKSLTEAEEILSGLATSWKEIGK